MSEESAAEPDLGAARLEPVDGTRSAQYWPASRCLSIFAAVMLHTAVFAAMLRPQDAGPGAGGYHLEAIGVEIVTAETLISLQKGDASASAPVSAASEHPGENAPDADDERHEREKKQPREVPTPADASTHDATRVDMPDEHPETTAPAWDRPEEKEAREESKPAAPSHSGGATAEGRDAAHASVTPARSVAQAGAVNRFVSDLRSRLARTKPRGLRLAGVAIVTFAIQTSGELEYARVSRSSGKPALDEAALAAVQRAAPFARPPPWMQQSELVFSIPYRFE